jgi:hypothetical protein
MLATRRVLEEPNVKTTRRGPSRRWTGFLAVVSILGAACSGGATTESSAPTSVTPASLAPSFATSASASGAPTATPTAAASSTPAVPLPSPGVLTLAWQSGGPSTKQKGTWYPAVDPKTGEIWAAAPWENVFWIFSPAGKYLRSWGTPGTGDGQLSLPDHAPNPDAGGPIAFAPDGSFFVGDTGNYRVEHFDANGTYLGQWGKFGAGDGEFAQIVGIATDGTTVYVGDGERDSIEAFDTSGHFLRSFGKGTGFIVLDRKGDLIGSSGEEVDTYDPTGKALASYDLSATGALSAGVAVDATGDIYVTLQGENQPYPSMETDELGPTGQIIRRWSTGGESIALAPDGKTLYYALGYDDGGGAWDFIRAYTLPKG